MDLYLSQLLFEHEAAWAEIVSAVAKFPGYAALATGVVMLTLSIKRRDDDGTGKAVYLISGVALTVIVVFVLKELTARRRFIELGSPEAYYENFGFGMGGDSFPSGHVAMAASGIFLVPAIKEKYRKLFLAALIIWTLSAALARITLGAHYFTDTLVSCIIAFAISEILGYFILKKGYLNIINRFKQAKALRTKSPRKTRA